MNEKVKTGRNVEATVYDVGGVLIEWNPRYLDRRIFDGEEETERFLATVCTPEWNAELDSWPFVRGDGSPPMLQTPREER